MKRIFTQSAIISTMVSMIAFSGCTKTEYVDREIIKRDTVFVSSGHSIDAMTLCIATEGGTNTATFSTTEAWNASIINDRADGWLSVSPKNGDKGVGRVELKATANDSSEERSATLRISSGKGYTDFNVIQKPVSSLLATTSKYEIQQQGGEFSVEIKSDVDYSWEVESDAAQWLTGKQETKGLSANMLCFQVAPNNDLWRAGRIIFKSGSLKEVISVYQEGKQNYTEHIVLSGKDCQIASDGGTIKIELSSQYDVSLRIPEGYDWIKEGNNQSTNTYYLQIDPNSSTDARDGFVSFTDKKGGFSENVSILQLQKDAIALAKNSYMFGNEGGTLDLEVLANNPVEVSIDAEWVQRVHATKSMTAQGLTFDIAKGYTGEDRTAVITLKSGSAYQKITVHQFPINDPITFACSAVKDRLVKLFDANCDGELSYKEAAEVTSLFNVFNEVEKPEGYGYSFRGHYIQPEEFISFDEIKHFTGVTEIPPYAFYQYNFLSRINIPEGVKKIGERAFSSTKIYAQNIDNKGTGLLYVKLPDSLESIGDYAFYHCPLADGLILPESLKEIGRYAFNGCYICDDRDPITGEEIVSKGLKSVKIPESVEFIGSNAFRYCKALTSIEISSKTKGSTNIFDDCPALADIKGTALSSDGKCLIDNTGYLYQLFANDLIEFAIPEGVTKVCDICPKTLRCITVPSTLSYKAADGNWINPFPGYSCLEMFRGHGATSDGSAIIKDNVLVSVVPTYTGTFTIPDNIVEVAIYAFQSSLITSCVLSKGIKAISYGMFNYCMQLEEVKGIEHIETIGMYGFAYCDKLLSHFKVPASVKSISELSFYTSTTSIIEFESFIPPTFEKSLYTSNTASAFGKKTSLYVPDIAYERYTTSYYSFGVPVYKASELYEPAQFDIEQTGNQIILRVKGDEDSRHYYALNKVEKGSFRREVPSTRRKVYNQYEYDYVNVNITQDFYIGESEFPQWLWQRITHTNPSYFTDINYSDIYDSDNRPVESVSSEDCDNFISELNRLTGLSFRLPTESEWEYAAKGGKNSQGYRFSGSDDPGSVAVYMQNYTETCKSRMPNELGLYDMNGNVSEMCQMDSPYENWLTLEASEMPQGDALLFRQCKELYLLKVARGGYSRISYSLYNGFSADFSGNRRIIMEQQQSRDVGFRLAL